MNDLSLIGSLAAGAGLGLLFLATLWWSVRYGLRAERPALWILLSSQLRTAAVVVGFYLVGQHDWRRFVACMLGFLLVRGAVALWQRQILIGAPAMRSGATAPASSSA